MVTNIQLSGKTIAANHLNDIGPKPEFLTIQADANSIAVEFAALDYAAPERNRYAYRLDGYDSDWIESDQTRRLATYTNLDPGDYRLRIRGSNRNGTWSEQELVMPIRVLPTWFQTWWAKTLFFMLMISILYLLFRWRLWTLKQRNHLLELLVLESTKELNLSHKKLEEQSLTDPLTGIRNRRYLNMCIEEDIAQVNRSYQAKIQGAEYSSHLNIDIIFIMIDLDHFKLVNDEYGHAAGDLVLTQTTTLLQEIVRDTDTIIRWGDEEFLIVARKTNHAEIEIMVERIRLKIAAYIFDLGNGKTLQKTCSLGLTAYPFIPTIVDAYLWEYVIDIADQCLYAAKRSGRNAWVGLYLAENTDTASLLKNGPFDVAEQIALGRLVVRSSISDHTSLDWSHGQSDAK